MCRGKLAGTTICSCSSVKLTGMSTNKQKNVSLQDIPTATHSQDEIRSEKHSHPRSLYSIRRQISYARTRPYRTQTSVKSNKHLSLLPSENNESDTEQAATLPIDTANHTHFYIEQEHNSQESNSSSDNDTQIPHAATTTGKTRRTKNRLHTVIPAPIPDEYLSEARVCEDEETLAERLENDYLFPSTPLELIGLADSSDSIVDLESIHLEEDETDDIGPEAVVLQDNFPSNSSTKKVIFREHQRSHSMSEAHRKMHVLGELLFSIDFECGTSDTGPEPQRILDTYSPATSAESTKNHTTERKHRNSDSEAIIESLFAQKRRHSCCKNRRKSSWNAEMRRKSSGQVNVVPRHRPRKIVVIGDMCSGKSSLISAYCKDRFNETYVPTILRNCLTDAIVQGEKVEIVVIEVSGREDYEKLRKCAYRKTDAIILCYSCDNSSSLQRIKTYWLPEIHENIPNVPVVLVGTKKDIRDEILGELRAMTPDERAEKDITALKSRLVTESEGHDMSESIGAQCFLECSARYRDGTRHVFETVAKVALQKSRRKKKMQRTGDVCSVM